MKEDLESRQPVTSEMCQPSCRLRDMQDYGVRRRSYGRYLTNTATSSSTFALKPTQLAKLSSLNQQQQSLLYIYTTTSFDKIEAPMNRIANVVVFRTRASCARVGWVIIPYQPPSRENELHSYRGQHTTTSKKHLPQSSTINVL